MKNQLKKTAWLLGIAALLAGCAQTPDVTTYVDPLTNQRTELMSENELVVQGQARPREILWLNASRLPVSRNKYNLSLEVLYAANVEAGALDIYPGATLTVIADGKEMKFSGLGSMNDRKEKGGVLYESARYDAQVADIAAIANAKKVTVLVRGKTLLLERDFAADNFERFKLFLARVTAPAPPASLPPLKSFN